jgi:hypothetical protein
MLCVNLASVLIGLIVSFIYMWYVVMSFSLNLYRLLGYLLNPFFWYL